MGLFAELLFLTSEVMPTMAGATAVRSWRGPYREAQDFRFGAAAVEIKASSARIPQGFRVANLDQLETGSLELLLVYHVTVDTEAASGRTLPEMVNSARAALLASDPAAASDFDFSLLEAGYLDAHADSYDRKFGAIRTLWLVVGDGFPKLTRGCVPAGIAEAAYSIVLQSCAPFAISATSAREMIKARF